MNVKICGITNKEDTLIAVNAGADAIGVIIGEPRSPRSVTIAEGKQIMSCVPSSVTKVVVTPCSSIEQLTRIQHEVDPDAIQLQEKLTPKTLEQIARKLTDIKLIGVLSLKKDSRSEDVLPDIKFMESLVSAINLDSKSTNGRIGGSGSTHNWNVSRVIRDTIYPKPTILAGGLTPDNVSDAIKLVQPWGVDVASGVENIRPGKKNPILVTEFIKNAKESVR